MLASNGIYLIILVLCIIGGWNLKKLKRKNKKKEKQIEDEVMTAMQKEVQRQLELAKKETEGEDYEEEITQ